MSASFILASNMVSAVARAYLESATGDETATVDGDISITAADNASISADTAMYGEVSPTNDAGAGILNSLVGKLLDDYQFTSNSGTQDLAFGDRVRVADDYDLDGDCARRHAGKLYEWMGTALLGTARDLGAEDYTDFELWKELTPTSLMTDSVAYAVLGEVGTHMGKEGTAGSGRQLLRPHRPQRRPQHGQRPHPRRHGRRGLGVRDRDGRRVHHGERRQRHRAVGRLRRGHRHERRPRRRRRLHREQRRHTHAGITTSGDVLVAADNVAQIDATSTSHIEAWTAVSVVLVFNSIGWKPSNILFNAVDALLGDPLISAAFNGEQPAHAIAYIRNTPVDAGGAITVVATSAAQLNATAGNENVVEAAVDLLFTSAGQKGEKQSEADKKAKKKKKIDGYGASGLAGGGILASNKVSSLAKAFIDFTTSRGTVMAVGAVAVSASDTAGIDAQSTVVQSAVVSNDLSGIVDIVNEFIIPGDYDFTTASGVQEGGRQRR